MIINSTKINYSPSQATEAVLNELNKKSFFSIFRTAKQIFKPAGEVKLIYFPYWIGFTISNINVKVLGRKMINMIIAVEGYKGETGISLGFSEVNPIEANYGKILEPKIDKNKACYKIITYTTEYITRRNRHLPNVTIRSIDLIWKPTYVIPVCSNENDNIIYKLVDAESNYIIYRYDLELDKLINTVPELKSIAI